MINKKLKGIIIFIPMAFFFSFLAHGQGLTELPKPLDVFLAIDQSGSMEFTDPHGVRISSAKYFVDFLASQRSDFFNHRKRGGENGFRKRKDF